MPEAAIADGGTAAVARVFWSGGHGLAKAAAEAWAEQTGASTLEMSAEGQALEGATAALGRAATYAEWKAASAQWASGASGEVTVFHFTDVGLQSTWATTEYPILMANPAVTGVRYMIVLPNGTVVPAP
jgi:hypothetical protein